MIVDNYFNPRTREGCDVQATADILESADFTTHP